MLMAVTPTIYVRGLVAYDGTDYKGFQFQNDSATIQGELENALASIARFEQRVIGAGRTDTGVHASGQVIAVRVVWNHAVQALQRAWNVHLPPTIRVRDLQIAEASFHPRFSAISRTYRYMVYHNRADLEELPMYSPLTDRYALYENRPLDRQAMNVAAQFLVGRHDFATFGRPPQGSNTVRDVLQARWRAIESSDVELSYPGQPLVFTIVANAFLRHMVRNIVGSLLTVGRGVWQPTDIERILPACDRSQSAPPAPPNGLVLHHVDYGPM